MGVRDRDDVVSTSGQCEGDRCKRERGMGSRMAGGPSAPAPLHFPIILSADGDDKHRNANVLEKGRFVPGMR